MKKITNKIVLVIAVVGVWGFIVFRIINRGNSTFAPAIKEIIIEEEAAKKVGEYSLLLNYGDPFFPNKRKIQKKRGPVKRKKPKPEANYFDLKYNGRLSTQENIRGHFIYKGKSMILKPGDSVDKSIAVKIILNDSVLISYKHGQKWFLR